MNRLSEDQLSKISRLVREVEKLNDIEKLYLYLQLPCGRAQIPEGTSNKYKVSNGNKCCDIFAKKPDQETTQTYTWILSHLEEDPNVSLPKQEVYDEYRAFCQANRFEPLCVADFGKAMKHAFPCIKPRRLGQRGNSRYCYSGLRKKYKIEAPSVPNIINCHTNNNNNNNNNNVVVVVANDELINSQQHQSIAMNCCSNSNNNDNSLGLVQQNHLHQHTIKQEPKQEPQQHSFDYDHSINRLSSTQQQQQTTRNPYEAMNLKLETTIRSHDSPVASHLHHQQQTNSTYSNSNSINNNNGNQQQQHHSQHHHSPSTSQNQPHDMMPSSTQPLNQSSNRHHNHPHHHQHQLHSNQQQQNYHQLTVPNRVHSSGGGGGQAGLVATQTLLPLRPQHQQQQQPTYMPYSSQHYHLLQRSGTPDDDDYRHNYQDLHRPIVSAAIPFSQTMPAQLACIPPANSRLPPGTPFDYPPSLPPPLPLGSQHTTSCCSTAVADGGVNFAQTNGSERTIGGAHHQQQHYNGTNQQCNESGNESLDHQQCNSNITTTGQQQQSLIAGSCNSRATSAQQQHHRPQAHHPQHLRLTPTHLHSNAIDAAAAAAHTSDLCASPFQSPASTPYPMIGSCGSAGSSTGGGGGGLNSPYLTTSTASATSQQQQQHHHHQQQADYYSNPSTSTAPATSGGGSAPINAINASATNSAATVAVAVVNDCVQYSSID